MLRPTWVNAVKTPHVLIVADNASSRKGGEAILPLHHFRMLRRRGVEAWLIAHARTRHELSSSLADDWERIYLIPDTALHRLMHRLGEFLPDKLRYFSTAYIIRLSSQRRARRLARRLIGQHQIDVVHQPIPVSPRESSVLYRMGVPVVIGPMNGAMRYPPGFVRSQQGWAERLLLGAGRWFSGAMNRLMPGKLEAQVLLVANERTRRALPAGHRGRVIMLAENGVDLGVWRKPNRQRRDGPIRFVFSGRLIEFKGIDFLLQAMRLVIDQVPATLELIGDGPMRAQWEALAARLGLREHVTFRGWVEQDECPAFFADADIFVLPSVYECGGAVILEAMAMELPVIATDWGGPADYIDDSCGILVPPRSCREFPADLAAAMLKLARDPELCRKMGHAGRRKVEQNYDWERKIDRMIEVHRQAIACGEPGGSSPAGQDPAVMKSVA